MLRVPSHLGALSSGSGRPISALKQVTRDHVAGIESHGVLVSLFCGPGYRDDPMLVDESGRIRAGRISHELHLVTDLKLVAHVDSPIQTR